MSWIKNIAVILISTVLSLIFLEICLKIIFPTKEDILDIRDHSDLYLPKHAEGSYPHPVRNITANINNMGLRFNPYTCNDEEERKRGLIVGDSNIAAMFLGDDEILSSQLTKISQKNNYCIEFDSFGVSGFGPDQSLFALKDLSEKFNYHFVIFHLFADNDAGDLVRNNYFTNDVITNDGYCYVEKPFFEKYFIYKGIRKLIYIISGIAIGYGSPISSTNSNKCTIATTPVTDFSNSMHKRSIIDWKLNRLNKRQIYMGDRYDIDLACQSNLEAKNYISQYFSQIITEIEKLEEKHNFQVIYLIQPSEYDVTNNHSNTINKGCTDYEPKVLTNIFYEILKDKNVLNLYENFYGCNDCYFTESELGDDNHWSPKGVEISAELLFKYIQENLVITSN